jgi:hypothetical protein
MSDQVLHQFKTTGKTIVLYIRILNFWIANWKRKNSAPNNNRHYLTSGCS